MNKKLFTFRPGFWLKFQSVVAWIECQLRSDWINFRYKPALRQEFVATLKSKTSLLLTQAQGYWDHFSIRNSSKVFGEDCSVTISCTDTLTPVLFFMHFRLMKEIIFYSHRDAHEASREQRKHVRTIKTLGRMMPTWEILHNRMAIIREYDEKAKWKEDWILRLKENDSSIPRVMTYFMQYILGAFAISFLAAVGYRTVSNPGQIVTYLAHAISGSTLPFNEAYGALAIVLIVLCEFVVLFLLISFHQPSTGDILNVLYDHDGNTQESMAEIANILEQEVVPLMDYRDDLGDVQTEDLLEKVGGNGHK
jgi:hypothetical protein